MTTNRTKAGKKWNAKITDRETANRAKVYVYGFKEFKRQEEVKKTNVRITECMRPLTPEPDTKTETESYTFTLGLLNSNSIQYQNRSVCLVFVYGMVISYHFKYLK